MRGLAVLLLLLPAACTLLPAGPQRDVVRAGDYRLELAVDRASYDRGDVAALTATLTYVGARGSVIVSGGFELVSFVLEQLDGPIRIEPFIAAVCAQHELQRGTADQIPYAKSGAIPEGDDPASIAIRAFLADPLLRFPAGRWRISGQLDLYEGPSCEGRRVQAVATIEFTVS